MECGIGMKYWNDIGFGFSWKDYSLIDANMKLVRFLVTTVNIKLGQ